MCFHFFSARIYSTTKYDEQTQIRFVNWNEKCDEDKKEIIKHDDKMKNAFDKMTIKIGLNDIIERPPFKSTAIMTESASVVVSK